MKPERAVVAERAIEWVPAAAALTVASASGDGSHAAQWLELSQMCLIIIWKNMQGLDTVESLSAGARGSRVGILLYLQKLY